LRHYICRLVRPIVIYPHNEDNGSVLPPATQDETALAQDLLAIATPVKSASASLTTMNANAATGTSYSPSQVTAAMTPVTGALTMAIQQLTATIPTLPADTVAAARLLSDTLSQSLEHFQIQDLPDEPDLGAAVNDAEAKLEIADDQSLLSSLGGLDVSSGAQFVRQLGKDVKL
jgi:hypothetical protein